MRTWLKAYGIFGLLMLSCLVNFYLGYQLYQTQTMLDLTEALYRDQEVALEALREAQENESISAESISEESPLLYVHVVGAVNSPGIYQLAAESRVFQAIEAAGGPSDEAALEQINLAQPVRDGWQIYVPKYDEFAFDAEQRNVLVGANGDNNETVYEMLLVNINTASQQELEQLSGIGEVKAKDIIAYREANGYFTDPEEIMQVKGIGPATYDKIKAHITVR